ncbi:MAG: aldo/keto reductase [Lachnospiraceae bacterium]
MKYGSIRDAAGNSYKLSKLIMGTVPFGSVMSQEDSFAAMDLYVKNGGNVIDTARVYSSWLPNGKDASEKCVGEWMKTRNNRRELILITKGGHPPFENLHNSRINPADIRSDFSESLGYLQTDDIDIYFLHRDDESVPVNIIMDTLHELVADGKVKMLGASNWRLSRILEANEYAKANGKTPFSVSEIQWSYVYCTSEVLKDDTLVCMDDQEHAGYLKAGIPVFAYSSQGHGVFSRGYKPDLSDIEEKNRAFYCQENIKRYQSLLEICEKENKTPSDIVLNYIMENELNGFAIVGCSRLSQLQESLHAAE